MVNYGSAATGAVTGAAAGSSFGPIGAGVGGIVGAVTGLFNKKPKDRERQLQTLTPEQQQALSGILGQLNNGPQSENYSLAQQYQNQMLQGSPEAYERFAAPYMTQFQEQTLPGIAERFAGMAGAHGNPANYSGFSQTLGGAATQFQSNLAGLYAQLQQQAAQQAFGQHNTLAGLGLGTPGFQAAYQPGNIGAFGNITSGVTSGFANAAGKSAGKNFMDLFNKGSTGDTNQNLIPGTNTPRPA